MDQFSKDIEKLLTLSDEKRHKFVTKNIHPNLGETMYFSGLFMVLNSNPQRLNQVLDMILKEYPSSARRCVFLKTMLNKSVKLKDEKKIQLTKIVFESKYFADMLELSSVHCAPNAKAEQACGPFCLLFPTNRMTDYKMFAPLQDILVSNEKLYTPLLKYFQKLSKMNFPYVDCDEQKCFTECSNDDLNMFIMDTTRRILVEKEYQYTDPASLLGPMINNLFASKMRIRNVLIGKLAEFTAAKNVTAKEMITKSLIRLEESVTDKKLLEFVKNYSGSAVDDVDSDNKLENLCWLIAKHWNEEDFSWFKECECMECFIDYLDNESKCSITTMSAVGLILDRLGYYVAKEELKTFEKLIVKSVESLEFMDSQHAKLIRNTSGFTLLIKNFMGCVTKSNKGNVNQTQFDFVLKEVNEKCDQPLFLSMIHGHLKQDTSNPEKQKKCLGAVKRYLKYNKKKCDIYEKEMLQFILEKCKMSKHEVNTMKIRYRQKYPFLAKFLEESISLIDKTKEKIKDALFPSKTIVDPVFVTLEGDGEIVIDKSTMETTEFKAYIDSWCTVEKINKYNKLPEYINKRIKLLSILSAHKAQNDK